MPHSRDSRKDDFAVRVQTPDALVWEGRAEALSSKNSAGPFDILPDHANMITIIEGEPIEIESSGGSRKFIFEKAVIEVKDGSVIIYANLIRGGKRSG